MTRSPTQKLLPCGCPRASFGQRTAGDFTFRYAVNLPCCTQGRHQHPEPRIVLSLQVGFDTRFGPRRLAVRHSAALFRPAGEDHEDRYAAPVATLALLLPAGGPAARLHRPFVIEDAAFTGLAGSLHREMRVPDSASPLVMEGLALLAASKVLHERPLEERHTPKWVATVRERVEANYLAPPSLAELGRMVGRDAAHVAATFKRVYGNSVGAYLRQRRLWQARHWLDAEPERSLTDVAVACGFADQSHFARHFKRLFMLTPGEYRRRQGLLPA